MSDDVANFFLKVGGFVLLCENTQCLNPVSLSKVLHELLTSHLSASVLASLLYRIYQSPDTWVPFNNVEFSKILSLLFQPVYFHSCIRFHLLQHQVPILVFQMMRIPYVILILNFVSECFATTH